MGPSKDASLQHPRRPTDLSQRKVIPGAPMACPYGVGEKKEQNRDTKCPGLCYKPGPLSQACPITWVVPLVWHPIYSASVGAPSPRESTQTPFLDRAILRILWQAVSA